MFECYKGRRDAILVGTSDSPLTMLFYESLGFVFSHRLEDFFLENYDHPMYEGGKSLTDMLYFIKKL